MQLTKGQKDALVRKVMSIIEEKKNQKREELRKDYKPSKEVTAYIKKLEKLFAAREQYHKVIKDCGFELNYSHVKAPLDSNFYLSIYHEKDELTLDKCFDRIRDNELGRIYDKQFSYPDECSVMDEIELLNLSKSFDVDSFLEKYKNM